jgi:tetratricopeptide (TPR) repeat protein
MKLDALRADWQRVSALLDEALELPVGQRAAWLAALDGEAALLRETLSQLLGPASTLETDQRFAALPRFEPASGDDGAALTGAKRNELVGPYRLISELGRGGMGSVWLAERADGQPRRKVALKLPHVGWAPGLAARLGRERDIVASLEHPNIARLYDAGVDALGRPYLALEYVDGTPIDRYCAALQLPLRQRLALILQVAAAVAHAHTRLVVHRDLKPSNILVAGNGEVRLLDFGIAKLLQEEGGGEASELTRMSGRALTPDYASPEQIRGEPIGTASDVYSLGVVAYELVTGTRPYRLKEMGSGSIVDAIADAPVPLPSRAVGDRDLARQLSGDIDAILNKALKKDPAERYATVAAFADDIDRHLRDEPVSARPDGLGYRTRKFVLRHGLQVGAAALVLVAVLVGSGVAVWQAGAARAEAAHAERVKDFALSIFDGANADSSAGAGAATSAVDLLKAAQAKVQSELADQPETAVELMTAIGSGLLSQGRNDDAAALLRQATDLSVRRLGPDNVRSLAAQVLYGQTLVELGRTKEAATLFLPAVDAARRQRAHAIEIHALAGLSSAQLDLGEIDAGVASARAAVAVVDSAGTTISKVDAMTAWAALANALGFAMRPGEADAARHQLVLTKQVYGDRISLPVLIARSQLGKGLADEGQLVAGLDELGSALADSIRFLGPAHPETDYIANYLGNARLAAGDPRGAAESFAVAVNASEHMPGSNAAAQGTEHYGLGTSLASLGQGAAALPHFEVAARLLRQDGGADAPLALRALSWRAMTLARLGRLDESERAFGELASAHWTPFDKAGNDARLAVLRSLQGRHDEAVTLARGTVAAFASHPSPIVHANADRIFGLILLAAAKPADAIAPLQRAADIYAQKQLTTSPDRLEVAAALERARAGAATQGSASAKG